MLRALLLLLLNVMLTTDTNDPLVDALVAWGDAAAAECCPPQADAGSDAGSDTDSDGADCCDDDHGMCCVLVVAQLPDALPDAAAPLRAASGDRRAPHTPRLLPRSNGPPHRRPPIA